MGIHQVASDSVRLLMMFERVGRVHACTSECNVYECACMHVCVCVCVCV